MIKTFRAGELVRLDSLRPGERFQRAVGPIETVWEYAGYLADDSGMSGYRVAEQGLALYLAHGSTTVTREKEEP